MKMFPALFGYGRQWCRSQQTKGNNNGYPWRLICKRYGKTSRTLIDWHNAGIDVIVKVLNNPKSELFARNRALLSKYLSY